MLLKKQTGRTPTRGAVLAAGVLAAACVATLGAGTALADLAAPADGSAKACVTVKQLLPRANCAYSYLPGIEAYERDMTGINLSHSNLTDARLDVSNLTGANLSDTDLTHTSLGGADLPNAKL
ncbi:pentapeptide repeat-containing protein [Rhodococcus jostii]